MKVIKRIDTFLSEDEYKYLTKKQREKLPEKVKKEIIKKKKGK